MTLFLLAASLVILLSMFWCELIAFSSSRFLRLAISNHSRVAWLEGGNCFSLSSLSICYDLGETGGNSYAIGNIDDGYSEAVP